MSTHGVEVLFACCQSTANFQHCKLQLFILTRQFFSRDGLNQWVLPWELLEKLFTDQLTCVCVILNTEARIMSAFVEHKFSIQCSDTVGWATGRASGLLKC